MPEAVYLTLDQYVDLFGEAEAIRLTSDAPGAVEPDAETFDRAVADASADMDAYLGTKYTLPLSETPRLLVSIAAALVREKLHGTFPTDAVTKMADLARRQLGDLATGKAVLRLSDSSIAPVESDVPDGITILDPLPRVFDPYSLRNY